MKYTYAAYCLAIKNDFCLEESIVELFRQGVKRVLIVSPTAYWSTGAPQPEADYADLHDIAMRTGANIARVTFNAQRSENNAIYTEALYRNYGVSYFAQEAIDFILTVDADEFWLPGTLEHIDSLAIVPSRLKINLPAIPVIGVPGLPIEGAKDVIGIATSRTLKFQWGRSPEDAPTIMGRMPVIHFSATRRTLDEVIQKHRLSAHYPDPTYDFEGWIANTLPNVKVGMKNAHMYKSPDNIWPTVRAWTPAEWAALPHQLHPYLVTPS